MDIKKILTEEGKAVACIIEEGTLTYPIRIESLHNPDILDELLNSGWELYKLPYGLRKGNIDINDLPRGLYIEEGITKDQEVEMAYLRSNLYDNTDLKSKMKGDNVEYYEFKSSLGLIETREEFLKFLDSIPDDMDSISDEFILPINAIVKPSALFTVEEYINPKYSNHRRKLEKMRRLSIKQFTALVDKFKELGMEGEFTLTKFINFYFSWGIPGLNIPFISREENIENIRIDATNVNVEEKYKPYYKRRVLTYLDATGDVYLEPKYQNSGWTPSISESSILDKTDELKEIGYNYVAPILIEAKVSEAVTHLVGEVYEVTYDSTMCIIQGSNGVRLELPTVEVKDQGGRLIKSDFFEKIINKDSSMFDEFYIMALVNELIDRTSVKIDASSYDALRTTGASDLAISRYIFKNEDIIENYEKLLREESEGGIGDLDDYNIEEAGKKNESKENFALKQLLYSGVFCDKAEMYLFGQLPDNDPHYELISRIWEAFTSGELLVDNLQQGKITDANSNRLKYTEYIKVANRYLGISLDEICKAIASIDITTSEDVDLTFEGNGLAIKIPVVVVNSTERAYIADINDYVTAQANDAQYVYYVTGAIEELGGKYSQKRHVGAFGKCLRLYDSQIAKQLKPVMQILSLRYIDLVDEKYGESQRDFYTDARKQVIYNWIFQIGIHGKYRIPKFLLQEGQEAIVEATPNLLNGVLSSLRDFCDSTIHLMDKTFDSRGKFYAYCPNAIVTPYYVVPNQSNKNGVVEIPVYPFVPTFVNTIGSAYDEKVAYWIKNNMIPPIREADGTIQRGFASIYTTNCAPNVSNVPLNEQPGSLSRYWSDATAYRNAMGVEFNLGNPQHPYDKVKNGVETVYDKEPRKDDSKDIQLWRINPCYKTNKEEFIAKNPEFSKLYEPKRVSLLREVGFYRFRNYDAEDFLAFCDFEDLGFSEPLKGDKAILAIKGKFEGITEDGEFRYTDVEDMYESGEYKIKKISGRKYIMETYQGKLIGVIV